MSKMITVVCVDGIPICTVRGKKACADIVTKLQGYDVKIIDGRIDRLIEQMQKEKDSAPDLGYNPYQVDNQTASGHKH